MVRSGSRLVLVALVLAAAVGGYWGLRGNTQAAAPVSSPAPQPPTEPPARPAEPVSAPLPTPASAGVSLEDCIAYPDGTRLPPLNGVKKAPAVTFHRLVPYAKVVRKEFDRATGLEWYIHENGVRSTTRLQWRNGVQEAVAEIDMPRAPLPVDPK